jgi:hypothetical protein
MGSGVSSKQWDLGGLGVVWGVHDSEFVCVVVRGSFVKKIAKHLPFYNVVSRL